MKDNRRARLVLTILLLAAFTLIALDYQSGALGGVRSGTSTVFGPVEGAVDDVTAPIGSFFSSLGHLSGYKSDNAALRRQVSSLQSQLRLTAAQRAQLAQLEKIYGLASQAQYTVVGAKVTAVDNALGFGSSATIDVGSANGVTADETVVDGDGLVGRTVQVGRTSSTIDLANDPSFTVGARLEASQEYGSVTGGGRGAMTLTLDSSTANVAVGDRLVTLGSRANRPFVPEVPIGHVTAVLPQTGSTGRMATVVPYVDYTAIDMVAVVVKAPTTPARDSLLPPKPKATPTPTVTVTVTAKPHSSATPGTSASP
jgi:rod shape-determining protein MreC